VLEAGVSRYSATQQPAKQPTLDARPAPPAPMRKSFAPAALGAARPPRRTRRSTRSTRWSARCARTSTGEINIDGAVLDEFTAKVSAVFSGPGPYQDIVLEDGVSRYAAARQSAVQPSLAAPVAVPAPEREHSAPAALDNALRDASADAAAESLLQAVGGSRSYPSASVASDVDNSALTDAILAYSLSGWTCPRRCLAQLGSHARASRASSAPAISAPVRWS
jgi:hypothetical protein